jgi:hypothetical protein
MTEKSSVWRSESWMGIGVVVAVLGILVTVVSILVTIWLARHPDSVGVMKLQRFSAVSVIPSETLPSGTTVSLEGTTITPGHLQLRTYLLQNLTNHHITPSDFDAPLTAHILGGGSVVSVIVTLPANRPPLKLEHTIDTITIPPMLLNVGENAVINLMIATPNPIKLFGDPYANDDGVVQWTAEVKGVEFQVTGADLITRNMFDPTEWGIYILHHGMAIYALLATGLLFTFLQIYMAARRVTKFDLITCAVLALRIALAWSAAEALVSFADTLLATLAWANWAVVGAFVASLVPLPRSWTRKLFHKPASPNITT